MVAIVFLRSPSLFLPCFLLRSHSSHLFLILSMENRSYANFTTNSANPYYLHQNKNPALVFGMPPLTDQNYHTWASSMQIALISKSIEKFIDGTLNMPPVSGLLYAQWICCIICRFDFLTRYLPHF